MKQVVSDAQIRLKRSALAESKHALRCDIGQLTNELGALLPKYWWWVESSKYRCDRDRLMCLTQAAEERFLDLQALGGLYQELCALERTFTTALDGPRERKTRKMFF